MKPSSKPRATRNAVLDAAVHSWWRTHDAPLPEVFVFGVRGYYRDTMGKPGANDRAIYDDAFFVIGPETYAAFNGNTDPSRFKKGVASLVPGWYPYRPGNHGLSRPDGGYPAFRPATKNEELPVIRDGETGISKRPGVAINIHRGGYYTTSSEGCQTIYPAQWDAFHSLVLSEMRKVGMKKFWYGLIDGPII